MAISLVVISFVAGIALGQWFKVLILVPVMSLALGGTIAAGIARADDVWSIARSNRGCDRADWVPRRYLAAVVHCWRKVRSRIAPADPDLGSRAVSTH